MLEEEMATAIGDALALAINRLEKVGAESKIIVLLSDGESNAGVVSPEEAAAAAKEFGIKNLIDSLVLRVLILRQPVNLFAVSSRC